MTEGALNLAGKAASKVAKIAFEEVREHPITTPLAAISGILIVIEVANSADSWILQRQQRMTNAAQRAAEQLITETAEINLNVAETVQNAG